MATKLNFLQYTYRIRINHKTLYSQTFPGPHFGSWTTTLETPVEEIWLDIKQIALSVMDKFVPNKFTSTRYTQPWMTRECKTLIRKMHRLYNRARRSNSILDWDRFKEIRKNNQKFAELPMPHTYRPTFRMTHLATTNFCTDMSNQNVLTTTGCQH